MNHQQYTHPRWRHHRPTLHHSAARDSIKNKRARVCLPTSQTQGHQLPRFWRLACSDTPRTRPHQAHRASHSQVRAAWPHPRAGKGKKILGTLTSYRAWRSGRHERFQTQGEKALGAHYKVLPRPLEEHLESSEVGQGARPGLWRLPLPPLFPCLPLPGRCGHRNSAHVAQPHPEQLRMGQIQRA